MDWILKHKLTSFVIAFIVAVGGWYMLSGSGSPSTVLTTTAVANTPAGAQNLVESLLTLRTVSLDSSLFSNPAYLSLQDDSTPIQPEAAGRSDPFAPLPSSAPVNDANTKLFAPAATH